MEKEEEEEKILNPKNLRRQPPPPPVSIASCIGGQATPLPVAPPCGLGTNLSSDISLSLLACLAIACRVRY